MTGIAVDRYVLPPCLGAVVTVALVLLMQWLIRTEAVDLEVAAPAPPIEFWRVIPEAPDPEPAQPERPEPAEAPPEVLRSDPVFQDTTGIPTTDMRPPVETPDPTGAGSALAVPMVKIAPDYPRRALARGLEGHVVLRFDVNAAGGTEAIEILEAEPPGIFDAEARAAVARYRYRPAVQGGEPVPMEGLVERIVFRLDGGR
jgi:protein TonB